MVASDGLPAVRYKEGPGSSGTFAAADLELSHLNGGRGLFRQRLVLATYHAPSLIPKE